MTALPTRAQLQAAGVAAYQVIWTDPSGVKSPEFEVSVNAATGSVFAFLDERMAVVRPEEGRSPDPAKATRLLEVPHPEVGRRLFVLAPLADLAPDLVPPGWVESVAEARARRESIEGASAVRPIGFWDPAAGRWVV